MEIFIAYKLGKKKDSFHKIKQNSKIHSTLYTLLPF